MRASLLRAALTALLLSAFHVQALSAEPAFRIYLTASAENEIPLGEDQRHFDCSDTIYAVVEVNGLRQGKHQLEAVWRDPDGRKVETTRYSFHATGGHSRIWSWLRLHGPEGIAGAIGRAFDPSLGMEAFIGEWTVQLFIDGDPVASKKFEILC